jgi:gephyrin
LSRLPLKSLITNFSRSQEILRLYADQYHIDCIFTTGGTGFAPRDVTPEATKAVISKDAPQLTLAMSLKSLEKTKFAVLSRAVCGIRNQTLIVNFPGSKKAVTECFEAIASVLPHALAVLKDEFSAVKRTHGQVQAVKACQREPEIMRELHVHVCPHKTGGGGVSVSCWRKFYRS